MEDQPELDIQLLNGTLLSQAGRVLKLQGKDKEIAK